MNTVQRIIRIFAILLAIAIIAGICNLIYEVIMTVTPINTKIVVKEYEKEFKDIDSLDIKVGAASLTIKEGDKITVKAENLPSKLKVKKDGKTLIVKQSSSRFNLNSGEIEITVPKELVDVDINGGAGTIDISGLKVIDFDLKIGAGRTVLSDMETERTEINGGAGSLEIDSSKLSNLNLEAGAGRVLINSYIYGKSNIECGIGRMDITLRGEEDSYSIKAEKGLGSLTIAGEEYGKIVNYGKGKNKIYVEGGVGEISIRFKRETSPKEESKEEKPSEKSKEEPKEKSKEEPKKEQN